MKDYRNTSGGIHKQAESHHEWSVIMVEHLFPGKKATARFIMLEGNYHDWAAQSVDTSPPMVVFNEDEDITIVDHNDCTCALKDEVLKVTFNSDVGAFIPVGSSGLVRQAIVDDTIDYGDSGDVFLARCGTQITPTATVTAHNCHNDKGSAAAASSKVIIAYIQGHTNNTVYRQGAWQIISSVPGDDTIRIRNNSELDVEVGGVLMLDGTLEGSASLAFPDDLSTAIHNAIEPIMTSFNKRICIPVEPIAVGEIGRAKVNGHVPVKVYSEKETDPFFAHIARSSKTQRLEAYHRQSNYGFPILWRENGTGEKWAVIDLEYHDQPGFVGIYAWGMTPGITLPAASGQQVVSNVDMWYHDPSQPASNYLFKKNTNVDVENTPTGLRISGPSTWRGTLFATVHCSIKMRRPPALYGWPASAMQHGNIIADLKLVHYSDTTIDDLMITSPTYWLRMPHAGTIQIVDPLYSHADHTWQSHITLPFTLQTRPGNKVSRLCLKALAVASVQWPTSDWANPSNYLAIYKWSLEMHEINPMMHGSSVIDRPPTSGVNPGIESEMGFVSISSGPAIDDRTNFNAEEVVAGFEVQLEGDASISNESNTNAEPT